jgi:1-acyl-sn-glycerol-3-phosphate acyltransferase
MPPRAARRLLAPLWLALGGLIGLFSPLLAVLAAIASALLGRRQPLLLLKFTLIYFGREAVMILACGGLWVLSGFGAQLHTVRLQVLHYRLLRWFLSGLIGEALSSLNIKVEIEPAGAAEEALSRRDKPLLLFSRHAGPGDSLMVVFFLLDRFGRLPRIVMKEALAVDPVIDLVVQRLPNALLDTSDQDECETAIAGLAETLDDRGVLVLFPEGGNFSQDRRRRAIDRLRRDRRHRQVRQAEEMEHVLPPKPGGALAALAANPGADVVFAAHTGLGHETFPSELWRKLPSDRTLHMRMWLAPAAERPADEDGQIEWLFGWWKQLDDWIEAKGAE